MSYGQSTAQRTQETRKDIGVTWTALEGTTALTNRFAIEVYNRSAKKIFLSYSSSSNVKYVKAIGGAEMKVEPCGNGLTLYGRCATGTARVIITEYGH